MDHMLPFLFTGIVLLIVWVILLSVRSVRNARQEMLDAVRNLGFIPTEPTPELLDRMKTLYTRAPAGKRPRDEFKLHNVFTKRLAEGEMFVFDLTDLSSDDNRETEKLGVAIVSPRLVLPHFVMLPRVGGKSALAPIANKALAWVARNYGDPVDLAHATEFSERYMVSSHDPDATRRFLNAERLRRLAEIPNAGMHAGGDTFAFSHFETTREPPQQRLRERVEHATRILSVFTAS